MRNYGINYDTGLTADGDCTRKRFDDAVVQRELQIIAGDLAGIIRTAPYDVNVPFMQLGRHGWDIHAV